MTGPDQSPLPAFKAAAEILDAQDAREPAAVIVPVSGPSELIGQRIVVRLSEDGTLRRVGSFGDAALDEAVVALAERALEDGSSKKDGVRELVATDGSKVGMYVEAHHLHPDLIIVGAGHIAQPLCSLGSLIGFRVIVVDDRPDFATDERFPEADRVVRVDFADPFADIPIHAASHVVLVTRGHKYDYECLRHLLGMEVEPPYIGMIGSRRRVRAAFAQLVKEGLSRDRLAKVQAPLGLDIGAETPAEIAVSVAAEIVLLWRGGAGSPLADKERVLERYF
jgi:xanthine dehydrogenase accessory factor